MSGADWASRVVLELPTLPSSTLDSVLNFKVWLRPTGCDYGLEKGQSDSRVFLGFLKFSCICSASSSTQFIEALERKKQGLGWVGNCLCPKLNANHMGLGFLPKRLPKPEWGTNPQLLVSPKINCWFYSVFVCILKFFFISQNLFQGKRLYILPPFFA